MLVCNKHKEKCSASKYRPSENTTTVLFTRKQCQTFYFFDILIGYRDVRVQVFVVPRKFNFDLRLKGDFIRDRKNDTRSFANFLQCRNDSIFPKLFSFLIFCSELRRIVSESGDQNLYANKATSREESPEN